MKNVLIVDDERSFLLSLDEGLKEYSSEFQTHYAGNGNEAIEILKNHHIDLVLTDLKMPELDGFGLLAHLTREYPDLPALVMTAYSSPDVRKRINALGSISCLEKPVDFGELVSEIQNGLSRTSEGHIHGIQLPAFLQLMSMERKTCTLTVSSSNRAGKLYFRDGDLIDAETRESVGMLAAYEIVCWEEAGIEIDSKCRHSERRIDEELNAIMLDALRQKDEGVGTDTTPKLRNNVLNTTASSQKTEDDMNNLKDILESCTNIDGVIAACLVSRDGFLMESSAKTNLDTEMIAAIASNGFGAAESIGRQLGQGPLRTTMFEFETGPVLLSPVGEDGFIVIVADPTANPGMIRFYLKKNASLMVTAVAA